MDTASRTTPEEQDLALSRRLVTARTRFVQLSRQNRLGQLQLEAHARARQNIADWDPDETIPDRRARLQDRIRQVQKELDQRRSKRTISQGAILALDQSLLVNSHLQSFDNPPLPSRHALVQRHIVERDNLAFDLLRIQKELSEVSSRSLQVRKQMIALNRENSSLVKSLRSQYRSPTDIVISGRYSLSKYYRDLEDDILLLQSRLSIISPVLQTLISESPLPYFSPTPLSPEALLSQLESPRSRDDVVVDDEQGSSPPDFRSNQRWMGLMLLAGEDWTEEWDPLVEGAGIETDAELPDLTSDE
ncbi:hypothetical protein JCM11491_003976 [Sporobolomyces phaffii]